MYSGHQMIQVDGRFEQVRVCDGGDEHDGGEDATPGITTRAGM